VARTRQSSEAKVTGFGGHVDNSIVIWIVLILLLITVPNFFERFTGQTMSSVWRSLPDDRMSFLVRTAILLVAVPAATAVAALSGGEGLRPQRRDDQVLIRLRQPGARTFGLGLCVVALYMTGSGLMGHGLFWWVAIGVGLVSASIGLAVLGVKDQVIVDIDRVVWESRFFRSVTQREECAVAPSDSPLVTTATHTTGGAFGQPLTTHHTVHVAGKQIHTGTSENRAEALERAISEALGSLWDGDSRV